MNLKIDFHVHSKYSFDSFLKPEKIIKIAKRKGLSGVAITDHDTIKGGVVTSELNKPYDDFITIVGAEMKTSIGDLIGIFLNNEIKSKEFYDVVDEIRDQGGIVLFPHPYRGHTINRMIFNYIDLIEGFNARMKSNSLNQKAQDLARKYRIPVTAGSDAHFAHEIGSGITIFQDVSLDAEEVRKHLLNGEGIINGKLISFPLYVSYEFAIGKIIKYYKILQR